MGNHNDGEKHDNKKLSAEHKISTYGEDGLKAFGNADANKLATTYKELSKDGLSAHDKEKLKDLDEALKGAEFRVMGSDVTLVVQERNNVETDFVVLGNGLKQNAGFTNPNASPGRKL